MSDVICISCRKVYPPRDIGAYIADERMLSLEDIRLKESQSLNGRARRGSSGVRVFLGARKRATSEDFLRLDHLRDYTFRCPEGHIIDGNPDQQFGVAVLGASGASKSHTLAGLVRELNHHSALRQVGVRITDARYTTAGLQQSIKAIYWDRNQLEPTDQGEMLGPYASRLHIRDPDDDEKSKQYSLVLYDVAGEHLETVVGLVDSASFVLTSRGLIVLINPVGYLPTKFDKGEVVREQERLNAALRVRNGINVIAEALTARFRVRSAKYIPIPICFVLAKADAIEWGGSFDWSRQTESVVGRAKSVETTQALTEASNAARHAFIALGGQLVVDEIEDSFNVARIRYAAASATSTMPLIGDSDCAWEEDPEPNGIALSFLHLLDLAGLLPIDREAQSELQREEEPSNDG